MSKRAHGEGSIYRSNDPTRKKRWIAQITLENGKKKMSYHSTQREASAALRKMLSDLEQGTLITARSQSVKAYFEQWLQAKRLELKAGTYQYYRQYSEWYILPAIGHLKLTKLTDGHIQGLYADLLKRISPNTTRLVHRILRTALGDACRQRKIIVNPCQTVTLPRQEKSEMSFLTPGQSQRLLATAKGHPLECLLTLAITTGMRQGELLALKWSDIDWSLKTVHVVRSLSYRNPNGDGFQFREEEPKTASSRRTIPLPAIAFEALKEHRKQQLEARLSMPGWQHKELVFTNDEGGYAWPATIREQLRKLLIEAELPALRFHDLRHTAATNLLSMGVNPKVVQEWLGHSDIRITLGVYGHVTESMRGEAQEKLNELFQASS